MFLMGKTILHKIHITVITTLFLLGIVNMIYAQQITGTVTDAETGKPLIGVNILVKGTTNGTITDVNGHYSLTVASLQDSLVFSYIGYETKTVSINGRSTVNVELKSKVIAGQQLVVVGYGKQTRKNITSSISTISSKGLAHTTTTSNTVNMLAGKIPGLRVKQMSSEPGSYATSFNIRGFGKPLVVIDGVPGGNLSRINPNDIKSISVIKDASGAEFGVRAANGVILVTTKKGKKGKINFNLRSTYGWATPTIHPETMNAYQYALIKSASLINAGQPPAFSKETLEKYKNGTLPSTNWQAITMRKFAPHHKEYLSASGGTKKINYHLSLAYVKQQGRYKTGDLNHKRVNFRTNVTSQITNNLKVSLMVSGVQDKQNLPGHEPSRINRGIYWAYPTRPPYANNNPKFLVEVPDGDNALAETNSNISGYRHNLRRNLTGVLKLDYQIPFVEGLELKGFYSFKSNYINNKKWLPQYKLYSYDVPTKTYEAHIHRAVTKLNRSFSEETQVNYHLSLNYNRTFLDNNSIKAFLLFDQITRRYSNFHGTKQFALKIVDKLYAGKAANQLINSNVEVPYGDEGIVGRLTYSYKSKYTITGKFRYDGSSKFGHGHRWGFFPSISAGWDIASENFIQNSPNMNFLKLLKLRASYGKVGDDVAANFQFLTGYHYPGDAYIFGGKLIKGFSPIGMPNPKITWYTSKILDIGLDAKMWNGKLDFSIDVYRRKRSGLLGTLDLSLPATVGASLPQQNLNSDLTRGIEFQISTEDRFGSAFYKITGNISYTRSKNLYIERHESGNSYLNWRSNNSYRWKNIYWGYTVIGRFQSMEEIKDSPIQDGEGNRRLLPGDLKYKDYNEDGVINNLDKHPIGRGNTSPDLTFGINLSGKWKNFDVNVFFQGGALSNISYLGTEQFVRPLPFGRSGLAQFMDRWHHKDIYDVNSPWVPGYYPANNGIQSPGSTNYASSTFWLQSSTYLRLKSVELGYTIIPKVKGVRSIRLFVDGYNLLTWTGLRFVDPERVDEYSYVINKTFNVGIDIKF